MKKSIFALLGLMISLQSFAINISGYINQNTTWTKANSPYIITNHVLIDSNATLTIEPGTVIKFEEFKYAYIDGNIKMQGTITDTIFITSNAKYPRATGSGFVIRNNKSTDTLQFEYCYFTYVGLGIESMATIVKNCLFEYCPTSLVNGKGARSYTHVSNCRFNYCEAAISSNGATTFTNNIVTNNKSYGMYVNTWNVNNTCTNNIFYNSQCAVTKCTNVTNNVICYNKGYGISASTYVNNNQIWYNGYGVINEWGVKSYLYQNRIEYNKTGIFNIDSTQRIHNNCIAHNNLNMDHLRVIVDVSNNYWGETDSTKIAATINDYWDNFISGEAKFMPFLQTPDSGCADSLTIPDTILHSTNIPSAEKSTSFSVYPNPTTNTLTIESRNGVIKDVSIYNLTGKLVLYNTANNNQLKTDVSTLSTGMYIYKIIMADAIMYSGKFMKE